MVKENFLKQFPKEVEYEASKLYNALEIAQEYEIISYTEEFYTPNFWKKLTKKINQVFVYTNGIFENSIEDRLYLFLKVILFKMKLIEIMKIY